MNARAILMRPGATGSAMRLAILVDSVGTLRSVDFEAPGSHPGIVGAGRGALTSIATDVDGEIYLLDPSKIVGDEDRQLFRDAMGSA